jgi:hypothetical protein
MKRNQVFSVKLIFPCRGVDTCEDLLAQEGIAKQLIKDSIVYYNPLNSQTLSQIQLLINFKFYFY